MIGNETDAALALTHPDTFLYSDEGSSRIVYLINGVIYKVDRNHYRDNAYEFDMYQKMTGNLPTGVFLPEMSLYRINGQDVIAAEFIDGIPTGDCIDTLLGLPCTCEGMCISPAIIDSIPMWNDATYGNAMWYDGALYLIDVA